MKNNLNLAFFGTPDFAVPALNKLLENSWKISAVYASPFSSPVKTEAGKHDIKIYQPRTLKDDAVFEEFKALKPNLAIVAAYGKIIPARYLEIPKHGFVNIHPSLLPKYRGPSPIQTAILNGDDKTGVSIMVVDQEVDHGPIIKTRDVELQTHECYPEMEKRLAEEGAELLIEVLPEFVAGKIKPKEQNHKKATFTKMFEREDGKINWRKPARKICGQVRALNPEPGTWTTWQGKILNIFKAEELRTNLDSKNKPGAVVNIQKSIAVKTETCYLNLNSIQLEGGKVMDAKSFVNGHPDFLNSVLE